MRLELKEEIIIDICIHITILFVFLYIFFYAIISKTGEQVLNSNIKSICDSNITPILTQIDKYTQDNKINVDWQKIKTEAQEVIDNPDQKINEDIENTNNYYKKLGIIIAVCLFFLCIILYFYFTYYKGVSIDISYLVKENLLIFFLIGLIEFVFFKLVGSVYIPAYPTSIGKIVLDRVKYNIKQKINNV